jgi:flavorubredoxin/flavin reductase (DIM6/NTAB) family NADH-FMN oxidoreductase RutF
MVALLEQTIAAPSSGHLTLQTAEIAPQTTAIRCLDWDRDRFDIEFELQHGTTYNSFLIRGDQIALVDTTHKKFQTLYLGLLGGLIDPREIDYLIVNHTEPDHSGLVGDLLACAPEITVVGSKVAIQFLESQVNQPFQSRVVKSGDTLDLGQGHTLTFISAPNLHWPDTIFTYDVGTQVLYTCDVFGMHYCDDFLLDEEPQLLEADFQYYYDCLMGPNARSVLMALKRMEPLSVSLIATGHGPLLQYHRQDWVERYRTWSQNQTAADPFVAIFYTTGYGYGEQIAQEIAQGLGKTGVDAELIDFETADIHEVRELSLCAAGLVIGMPPQTVGSHPLLSTLLATATNKQAIGLFESGGGQDEPIFPLRNQFQELELTEAFPPIVVKTTPTEATFKLCDEAGTDLGQWLTRDRTLKQMKALNSSLEKALGRLSNGLYILTTQHGNLSGAMVASWVIQASLQPLGVAIAIAKDRAIESLLQVGDTFVLNVLEEGNYQTLMKHFLKRFAPGADRFAGVTTYSASNDSPILADALAYMECTVFSRLETADHWLVYGTVQTGRVAKVDALTAVHHRKVGTHY